MLLVPEQFSPAVMTLSGLLDLEKHQVAKDSLQLEQKDILLIKPKSSVLVHKILVILLCVHKFPVGLF